MRWKRWKEAQKGERKTETHFFFENTIIVPSIVQTDILSIVQTDIPSIVQTDAHEHITKFENTTEIIFNILSA